MKTNGIWIAIGINEVNPKNYAGWRGELRACEFDAVDMSRYAKKKGFTVHTILTKHATSGAVINAIHNSSAHLTEGDTLVISYSGHGGQVRDRNGDEVDGKDETWCLYDRQFLDDEIFMHLSKIPKKLNIVIISDSCHSGTVYKQGFMSYLRKETPKVMPLKYKDILDEEYGDFYSTVKAAVEESNRAPSNHNIILLSGCQDNQYSMDGPKNGAFTLALKRCLNRNEAMSRNRYNYTKLHKCIVKQMPPTQTPNLAVDGKYGNVLANREIFDLDLSIPEYLMVK